MWFVLVGSWSTSIRKASPKRSSMSPDRSPGNILEGPEKLIQGRSSGRAAKAYRKSRAPGLGVGPDVGRLEHRERPLVGHRATPLVGIHDLRPEGALAEPRTHERRLAIAFVHEGSVADDRRA
jgi:hypothetical protein